MFRKIFALALILVLVALCTRRPFDVPTSNKLPNTCAAAQFAASTDEFDGLATQRDASLARIEALPVEEPAEYVRLWQVELALLRDLSAKAEGVAAPRCLAHAKDLFVQYLAQTQVAAEQRAPDKDPVDFRRARETADAIHAQYRDEVKLQEKNRL